MPPLISVVLSARNEWPHIAFTIHSILNALETDYTPDQYELIIVDNCSNDWKEKRGDGGTVDFLSSRGMFHNGVLRVMKYPVASNVGARNYGAKFARGKYLFFSDAHMSYGLGTFKRWIETIDESGGIVHPAVAWMGSYPPQKGYQYSWKLGEEFKGCVDEETEILTREGWKKWYEVSMETEFATVNRMNERHVEFQKPRDLLIKDYEGDMVHITHRSYDALLTPNHRVLYQPQELHRRHDTEWKVKFAENVSGNEFLPLIGNGIENSVSILRDEMVELVGWIVTEGCFDKDTITITQFHQEKRAHIESLLRRLDISYCIHGKKRDFKIHQRDSRKIKSLLPVKELTLSFLYKCSRSQLELLHKVLIDGDGTRSKTAEHFIQVNKNTVDAFQILCVLTGKASRTTIREFTPEMQHYGKKQISVVSVKKTEYVSGFRVEREKYSGKIWCPDLKNGTIFIRRKGHVMLTGNTWTNYSLSTTDWFYVGGMGHCSLGMLRQQFLDYLGYIENRCYGGGEMYLDTLWWMMGSCAVTEPRINAYHLSAGRGYAYFHDDYVHNVFTCSLALGADWWAERTYINYLRKGNEQRLQELWKEAQQTAKTQRKFVEEHRIMTFNELIVNKPWDVKNIEKFGKKNSGMLVFHPTWLKEIEKCQRAQAVYDASPTQKELAKFIEENLSQNVYRK